MGKDNPSGRPPRRQRATPEDNRNNNSSNGHIREPRHPIPADLLRQGITTPTTETEIRPHPLTTNITNNTQGATAVLVLPHRGADTTRKARLQVLDPMEGRCPETVVRAIRKTHMATTPTTETAGLLPRREEECLRETDEITEVNIPEATAVDTVVRLEVGQEAVVLSTVGNTVDSIIPPAAAAAAAVTGTRHHPITASNTRAEGHHHIRQDTTNSHLRRGVADNHILEVAAAVTVTTIHLIATAIQILVARRLHTTGAVHNHHRTKHSTRLGAAHLQVTLITIGIIRSSNSSNSKRVERTWSNPRER